MTAKMVRGLAGAIGVVFVAFGIWAMASPSSFFEQVATFPPYNEHFLHDVGAFQIGLGAALLLALAWRESLPVALAGFGVGGVAHAAAHVIDRDLGGRSSDPWLLGLLAIVALAAAAAARKAPR